MSLFTYQVSDNVKVKVNNIRTNTIEWRDAKVIDKRMVYPNEGERTKPYPILIVEVIHTYYKGIPVYYFIDGNIPVYKKDIPVFYDKLTTSMIMYESDIKLIKNDSFSH